MEILSVYGSTIKRRDPDVYPQEDILAELLKKGGGGFSLGAIMGKGGSKFGGLDIKRVYFG
jgi:hypothetical protein